MKTMYICTSLIVWSISSSAQPNNFDEALEMYLDLNNKRDSIVWDTMILINKINEKGESICDYSDYINTRIDVLEYYTEAIIDILENGNRQDISDQTRQETQNLVSDRRQRNNVLTSLLRNLIEDCTL